MERLRSFLSLALLGGLAVVLPVVVLLMIFNWLFDLLAGLVRPLTNLITSQAAVNELVAMSLVLLIILGGCFLIGLLVMTNVGGWLHRHLDSWLVKLAPGYKTIRELVTQLLGGSGDNSLFKGQPALAKIYGPDSPVQVTAIITSRHHDGNYTVFVPTAPIPTSGVTYHLPGDCVQLMEGVNVEEAMRTIIACGAGSAEMMAAHQKATAALSEKSVAPNPDA